MKHLVYSFLLITFFMMVGCGSSSSSSTDDPCTEDPNLPECVDNNDDNEDDLELE